MSVLCGCVALLLLLQQCSGVFHGSWVLFPWQPRFSLSPECSFKQNIRKKKLSTLCHVPLGSHKAGSGPNTQQFQGLSRLLQSKSKPTPDSSFSLETACAASRLQLSQGGNNEHTQDPVCKGSVWEVWVLTHSVSSTTQYQAFVKHSYSQMGRATRVSTLNCSKKCPCPPSVGTADNFLHFKPPAI